MKEKIIVTSGRKYIDIDGYAGIFAYKELLNSLGDPAYAKTTAYINESVPKIITDLGFKFDEVDISDEDKFIVLDVSNPEFFDTFVKEDRIIKIIDHHIGYEEYWQKKNINSQIEFIGSICTIIFEKYLENNKESLLTPSLCKLLIAGILDNTLNLKSNNATPRDIKAYQKLLSIGGIDASWGEEYFKSCYENIENTLVESIKNDTKIETTSSHLPKVFGQIIVLDISVIYDNMLKVNEAFKGYDKWLFNVICLKDGKSYLICSDNEVVEKLVPILGGTYQDNTLVLDKYMLRKEIIKVAKEYEKK